MKNINVLDSNTIDKIAAGEVVERPVAVAKELIENSIDAGASVITLEIKDGGVSYLRVTDNGEGIDRSQIKKAFFRHATSKIKSIEDLVSVTSLGFRGEALSSISSVSKVELLTKTKDELFGTRYVIEGGKECVFEDAGIPDGTTIIVKDLFYNIPARKKFLKSAQTEGNYITELIEHMILSHPCVSFKYIYNGNVKLQSPGNNDILSCIYSVYGRATASNLIEISAKRDDITISGYIGKPELARGTKNFEIYFVNSRFIKSSIVEKALNDAYKNYLMLHKYPVVFLYFDIPGYLIDVNVHPSKKEIRFIESESLKVFIEESVKKALEHKELIPEVHENIKENIKYTQINKTLSSYVQNSISQNVLYDSSDDKTEVNPEPFEVKKIKELTVKVSQNNDFSIINEAEDSYQPTQSVKQMSLFEEDFLTENAVKKHRIIGQLFNTYWLIEYDDKLYIIDQHAAHEKVNYERFIKKLRNNESLSQNIYPPVVMTFSSSEIDYINKFKDNFEKTGFTIEHFGGHEYTISSVPLELLSQNPVDYFHEMLDDLIDGKYSTETDTVNLKIATMACKASVKANMKMSTLEADKLISELLSLDNPYNCPHGRPTIVSYSKYEIEKMFKRVL